MSHPIARLRVRDGTVLVGGDCHFWPGIKVPAFERFALRAQHLADEGALRAIIMNGDVFDFPSISRHARIGWEGRPHIFDELQEGQRRLNQLEEIHDALFWPLGNHDARFETRLSGVASEYERVKGLHLKDHFPKWRPCWAIRINQNTIIKHKMAQGLHAAYNNVIKAACSIISGHTHRLHVRARTDYAGTRWGCESGMLGNIHSPAFADYTEAGPLDWQMGWLELDFVKGRLLWPRVMHVEDRG